MLRVNVAIANAPYTVSIEPGLLRRAGSFLAEFARDGRLLAITDSNVAAMLLPDFTESLAANGIALDVYTMPAGEGSKCWAQLEKITDWLLSHHVERGDYILALGGGVVGDITGFAAHVVKRGCHFIQIPTTLLAQVDSSVGGKTAINSRAGKNLVGAFHQPAQVLIDPDVLNTLPRRELGAGFAEVVKYGLIDDSEFFNWCAMHCDAFFAGDPAIRSEAIAHSVAAKARIVAADERETSGIRALLNLGHTFGHALEAETGYGDTLLHGEAVAAGMALAFRYSARLGLCPDEDAERVSVVLRHAALPTTLKEAGVDTTGAALVAHMLHDKKREGGTLPFLLARSIGATYLAKNVDLNDVAAFLDAERGG